MTIRLLDVRPICCLLLITISAVGAPPVGSPSPRGEPGAQISDRPIEAAMDSDANRHFAPMWIAVPKYPPDPAESDAGAPSASYAMIWKPEWQNELDLSTEQIEALHAIKKRALTDTSRHVKHFKSLSPEQQKAEAESWGGKSSPWRQELDSRIRTQIESVLNRGQLQALKEFAFPIQAVGLVYDEYVRREISFSPEQEDRFCRVVKEKLARSQEEYLKQADKIWACLTPQQQAELPEVVNRQGPTSAALSIAYYIGFDTDAIGLSYPLLVVPSVRERLELSAEQDQQLAAAIADATARFRRIRQEGSNRDSTPIDRQRLEAILTPQQLMLLKEIDFRRKVVLALSYPEKRAEAGMTDKQTAEFRRINTQTHEQLYRLDREMLDKALQILTPRQREQLKREIDQRIGG